MRREFPLSQEDEADLNATGLQWEAVGNGGTGRVIIYQFPVAPGYNCTTTTISLIIEPNYPDTQIDMAYFYPAIQRTDGKIISATVDDAFDNKTWQRWSRHRTADSAWRPGIDNISSHLAFVKTWLRKEMEK